MSSVAKIWDGSAWVPAIIGAQGPQGDPGIDIDEGSGFADGDILVYDVTGDAWVPQAQPSIPKVLSGSNVTASSSTKTISFPSGFFSSAPNVVVSSKDQLGASNLDIRAYNFTTSGFDVEFYNVLSGTLSSGTINFAWVAVE